MYRNRFNRVIVAGVLGITMFGCQKFLSPTPDNSLSQNQVMENPAFAEGLLISAYVSLPNDYNFNSSVASDDAVTNNKSSNYLKMDIGGWNSSFNPLSEWDSAYKSIYYINTFLQIFRQVVWSYQDPTVNQMHMKRLAGEAYGLRAWYEFKLLQAHSGKATTGELLGFPIVKEPLQVNDNWQLPRDPFSSCVNQIMTDCDSALTYLPNTYQDQSGNSTYNSTLGSRFTNRIPGLAVMAVKSMATLLAASPAFNLDNNPALWVKAASSAGLMIQSSGGLSATVSPGGNTFFLNSTDPDIIWSHAVINNLAREQNNFPPSLLGNGNTDPTQNLINAFPMKNGYPINNPNSGYDPNNPYQNRDPRLSNNIIYNGSTFKSSTIFTYLGAPIDGINQQTNSTRTGYYLRKFMYENVNLGASSKTQQQFYTYIRWTNVLLNYAEASNEVWGPDADPNGYGFTARSILGAIRKRVGITQPDLYLNSVTSKDDFRTLVHSERRIELCFEGHRFWDLRRWNEITTISQPVSGVKILSSNSGYNYTAQQVEIRAYQPYMIYGPIPYSEILKDKNLIQNAGW